jgi:hypothetical protein
VEYNPVFLRWVNRLGGIDQWCFAKRQRITYGVSEVVTANRRIEDLKSLSRRKLVVNKSGVYGMTIGAENISAEDWQALSWVIFSPEVQYYDIATARWLPVVVESKGSEFNTDTPVGKFGCNILFDDVNTQY